MHNGKVNWEIGLTEKSAGVTRELVTLLPLCAAFSSRESVFTDSKSMERTLKSIWYMPDTDKFEMQSLFFKFLDFNWTEINKTAVELVRRHGFPGVLLSPSKEGHYHLMGPLHNLLAVP